MFKRIADRNNQTGRISAPGFFAKRATVALAGNGCKKIDHLFSYSISLMFI